LYSMIPLVVEKVWVLSEVSELNFSENNTCAFPLIEIRKQ